MTSRRRKTRTKRTRHPVHTPAPSPTPAPRKDWLKWSLGGVFALGLWLVLADLSPLVLRGILEGQLAALLNAPVTVERLAVDPFSLKITVYGVKVPTPGNGPQNTSAPGNGTMLDKGKQRLVVLGETDKDGKQQGHLEQESPLLNIERLELQPQVRLTPGEAPIQIQARVFRPAVNIAYLGNGVFSFSALLPAAPSSGSLPLLALNQLDIHEGSLRLLDKPIGIAHTVDDLTLTVPFGPNQNRAKLSARINGVSVALDGLPPEEGSSGSVFALHTAPVNMHHFQRYLDAFTPLQLKSGTVALDVLLAVTQPEPGNLTASLSGSVRLESVEIDDPQGRVVGRLKRGEARLERFTLSERRVRLQSAELDGLYLKASRDKQGRIDWEGWASNALAAGPRVTPVRTETPFVVEGADLILRNADFSWHDAVLGLSADITGVDGRIAEYSTRLGARTAMRLSFGLNTEGVLALEGQGTLNPPSLDATFMADDLPLGVARPLLKESPLKDLQGRLAFRGDVRFGPHHAEAGNKRGKESLTLSRASLSLHNVSFGQQRFRLKTGTLSGLELDTGMKRGMAVSAELDKPFARLTLPATSAPQKRAGKKSFEQSLVGSLLPAGALPLLDSWNVRINTTRISGGSVETSAGAPLASAISLEATGLSGNLKQTVPFQLRAQSGEGQMSLRGTFRPFPLHLISEMDVTALELEPLDTLLQPHPALTFAGRLGTQGRFSVEEQDARLLFTASGNLSIHEALLRERADANTSAGCRRIALRNFSFASADKALHLGDVLLDRPRLRLALNEEGRLDLPRATPDGETSGESMRFSAEGVRLQDAALFFQDRRHKTTAALLDLNGSMGAFSTAKADATSLDLSGQLGGAPASLTGRLSTAMPLTAQLVFTLKGLDLTPYSPYVRTYLGYPLRQGRLDLKSTITAASGAFTLDNTLRLERPLLGPKERGPGIPDYPVELGLALLEDRNGNIELNLPVSGSLDGDLQIGGVTGAALGGLLTKIVTSPFALLGGIAGLFTPDAPLLQVVDCFPGRTERLPASERRLFAIQTVLRERPRLKLELVGLYEPERDTRGLKRTRVLLKVQRLKWERLPRAQRGPVESIRFRPGEYETLLRQVYTAHFGKRGTSAALETDDMEQRLEALEDITQSDLHALAQHRAAQVQAFLVSQDPGLDERVREAQKDGQPITRSGAAQVEMQFK